ncbi:MAG: EAL domain-containing protein [Nitrospira sp. CG24B]|nr:MAG: EAL domain-containing protein [Nitrospira sp. CG24B]
MTSLAQPSLPLALIVDDDPALRALSRMSLEQEDLRVEEASSGQAAIDCAAVTMPDIIILDLQMPGMDGFVACQQLRQLPRGEFVPILIMTGLDDIDSIAQAYEVGATDFIVKPCPGLILSQRVRYMLRASEMLNALRSSESRLAQAQRIAQLGGWEWDLVKNRMHVSDAACRILGIAPALCDHSQASYLARVHEADRALVAEAMREAVADGTEFDLDHRLVQNDGAERIVHVLGETIMDDTGRAECMVGTVQDVTDMRATEAKIYFLANYDSVTHLPNRSLFLHRVAQAMTCGAGSHVIGALLVVRLDRYHRLRDMHGSRKAEQLIKDVVERLQHTLSAGVTHVPSTGAETPVLARLSDDQFAMLYTHLSAPEDSAKVAHTLMSALGTPFVIDGTSVTLSVHIGLAIPGADGADADVLLRNAVTALQAATTTGQNSYRYYSSAMNTSLAARISLEQDLRAAIAANQFILHYQPQVDILSEKVIGFEALIRWQHPTRGLISPAEFIPVAEEEDLIIQMSEWVITSVAQQQRMWHKGGFAPTAVSINLSGLHFRQHHIAGHIKALVYEQGGNPQDIELELTETVLMTDASTTIATLRELKESGFRLAIDDFGTGYSSLAYLQRFPLDTLKIDRAFVKDLKLGTVDSPIIRAIIGMGRALKLHVVAEGVETRDELAFLRMQGCAAYQGYLFSKPVPANQLQHLLRDRRSEDASMAAERFRNRLAS